MRITNKEVLDTFADKHTNTANAVNKWVEIIENSEFKNHSELKEVFPSADYVGNERHVFNIKGNRYRLVVLVVFINGIMNVKFCGTHAQYDKMKDKKILN
ncbi:type II toxin-antitoxin system HigB family toxin [Parasediminibacterium sp. JCM 36343]|uniref:type II toxin-antitoxin system HigB family toxin n=1 Tax=Parasediminibacterium sp. JCM 36343 TaxID=3374279 RepID=UPI00397D7959